MSDRPLLRRRGDILEAALLDAAWAELVDHGFGRLTMESVARRARTSPPVLYRRWSDKGELAIAAVRRYGDRHPVEIPDTGSLRGDLIELMERISAGRLYFTTVVGSMFAGLMLESGFSPRDVHARLFGELPLQSNEIYRRAHHRGEIDLDAIPPDVLSLPFDLIRHDLVMTQEAMPGARIVAIVDQIFLPLAISKQPRR